CLLPNRPALLPKSLVKSWGIFRLWDEDTAKSFKSGLHPAFRALQARYGSQNVSVFSQSRDQDPKKEEYKELPLSQAIENMEQIEESRRHYIKDWHLFLQLGESQAQPLSQDRWPSSAEEFYTVPYIFEDDWMNHPREEKKRRDDFRFCYAGQAGSHTRLHADVYMSYSWSTNITGRKRWRMFPPASAPYLRRLPPVDAMDALAAAGELGPLSSGKKGWSRYSCARSEMIEFVQEAGETVFVPSNWYHEVLNLTECISFNHNWCNSVNLPGMYDAMKDEVDDFERRLEDVRVLLKDHATRTGSQVRTWQQEWTETVQEVVAKDMGWAWAGFWAMVEVNLREPVCDSRFRPENAFVRERVRTMIEDFEQREDFKWLQHSVHTSVHSCKVSLGLTTE
ncbi:Clavaminate synthase-like protein, partial [Tilletiaria anomala UBC 951]